MVSRRTTSSTPPLVLVAAGGVVLATAGYFGYSAYERARHRREAERLARPWLSKDAGSNIAKIDSVASARAALTSTSSSSTLIVVADLSNKGLRSLELAELSGVTSADLSGNEGLELTINSLPPPPPPELFGLLSSLRSLGLSRCALRSVPRGLSSACPGLSDLDLSHNELEGVLKGDLPKSLLRLNAQGNRGITSVEAETLAPLTNLVLLGLKSCSLESLPGPAMGKLTRLRELYVTDNKLRELPRELRLCESLVKLQASFNLLESLPLAELAELPKLEMLRAAACRISSLPGLDELLLSESASSSKGGGKRKNKRAGPPFRSLCWLSLAGNPLFDACAPPPRAEAARVFDLDEVLKRGARGEELGSGASGDVFAVRFDVEAGAGGQGGAAGEGGAGKGAEGSRSKSKGEKGGGSAAAVPTLAFKRFRGDAGPDGRAADEVSVARVVCHAALASTVGTVVVAAAAAAAKKGGASAGVASSTETDLPSSSSSSSSSYLPSVPSGLLLELVEGQPLAEKPRGDPLLRCTWPGAAALSPPSPPDSTSNLPPPSTSLNSKRRLSPANALVAAARLASALAHLHSDLGCAHGDFYAHNVLCDPTNGKATLVDFGAAFFYRERKTEESVPTSSSSAFEAFEQRAFGIFLRELAEHGIEEEGEAGERDLVFKARKALERAAAASADAPLAERPGFSSLAQELELAAREECGYEGDDLV